MKLLSKWLTRMFPRHRLAPKPEDIHAMQTLYRQVFNSEAGRELIELWMEQIVFSNPRSTDANECVKYAAQCAFVEDIIKALDRAVDPKKYEDMEQFLQVDKFDPRRAA